MSNNSGIASFLFLIPEFGGVLFPNSEELSGADIAINATGDVVVANSSFVATGIIGGDSSLARRNSGNVKYEEETRLV